MTDQPRTQLSTAPEREQAAARAADHFAERYGRRPDGVFSAPGRVNIIGEHVDYQQGLCLPMAISHRCFAAAGHSDRPGLRIASVQDTDGDVIEVDIPSLAPGSVPGWAGYVAGVLWAMLDLPGQEQTDREAMGLDILIDGQVPLGAGLSSSAALECATAEALEALLGLGTEPLERVRAAIRAETEFVGASTGGLDQSASVLSRAGHALLLDCRDFSTVDVPWDLADQDLALLIIDTRAEHSHVDGEYASRRQDSERAAELLGVPSLRDVDPADLEQALARLEDAGGEDGQVLMRRARHIVTEIHRVRDVAELLETGTVRANVERIGDLLDASHESLRTDYEVTVPPLDVAVEAARAAGAHGARMTGGGFGGSIIALVEASDAQDIAAAVARAFAEHDFDAPEGFLALPAAGAGRDL